MFCASRLVANVCVCAYACVWSQLAARSPAPLWTRCGRIIRAGSARRASGGPQVIHMHQPFRESFLLTRDKRLSLIPVLTILQYSEQTLSYFK